MEERMLFNLPAEKGRWILVGLGLLINLCLGTIYSWSVFVAPLTDYFVNSLGQTVTAGEILMPFSVFLACFAITMLFAGKYVEEWGPRNATIVGGILTGAGWMLASVVSSVGMLYLVYGVIGAGVGIYSATEINGFTQSNLRRGKNCAKGCRQKHAFAEPHGVLLVFVSPVAGRLPGDCPKHPAGRLVRNRSYSGLCSCTSTVNCISKPALCQEPRAYRHGVTAQKKAPIRLQRTGVLNLDSVIAQR